jgi:folate-dependent phosphoribosylglycinamide formyltransferase PurN
MRTVLLTTDTTHHLYWAWKVAERFPLSGIFLEMRSLKFPFETSHPFEQLRDEYEREVLLRDCSVTYGDLAPTSPFHSFNDADAVEALRALAPDVVIVFGSGKLHPPVISVPAAAMLNLHGGNPEQYRGLDTHLWAVYHNDFDNLVTTLHHMDHELDTGDLIAQGQLRFRPGAELHELRSVNTETCVDLCIGALTSLSERGRVASRRQVALGRYYSAMPAVLKGVCVRKFQRFTASV